MMYKYYLRKLYCFFAIVAYGIGVGTSLGNLVADGSWFPCLCEVAVGAMAMPYVIKLFEELA